jgi:hypothetical protein
MPRFKKTNTMWIITYGMRKVTTLCFYIYVFYSESMTDS